MPKERGRYKNYIGNPSIKMPISTKNNHLRRSNKISNIEIDNTPNTQFQMTNQQITTNSNISQNHDNVEELSNNSHDFESANQENDTDNSIEEDEILYSTLDVIINNKDLTKEELSAAYLAAFYNGRTSQKSLKDYLQLSNIYSPIKLPTSFDGLARTLIDQRDFLNYKKSWFCGICYKSLESLGNRFQRSCDICQTRLLFILLSFI